MRLAMRPTVTLAVALGLWTAPPAGAACLIERSDRDANGVDDLRILGSSSRQVLAIKIRNDGTNLVQLDCNNNGSFDDLVDRVFSDPGTIESYHVELLGNDVITIDQTQALTGAAKSFLLTLASGVNTVTYSSQGNDITATNLGLEVLGGTKDDTVTLDFTGSAIQDSFLYVRADLGNGFDAVDVLSAASITDSVVDVVTDLGLGNNRASFDDAGGLIAGSRVAVGVGGADLRQAGDSVPLAFSGQVGAGSLVTFDGNLRRGPDTFVADFALDTFSVAAGATLELAVKGGDENDTVIVNGAGSAAAVVDGLLELDIATHSQPDTVSVDWAGLTGSGTFRLHAYTGEARDIVLGSLVTDPASANVIDMVLQAGGEGDLGSARGDLVYLSVLDSGSATFGPAGVVTLDGGVEGKDACLFFGDVPFQAVQCES